jgi:hypothetical protein
MMRFGVILALGCGEYVKYEGGGPIDPIMRGSLDEETRAKLSMVDRYDHLILEGLLSSAVVRSEDGLSVTFDYTAVAGSAEAQLLLDQYLAALDIVRAEQLRDGGERLAYFVNAYNATVIRSVLDVWGGDRAYSVSNDDFVLFKRPSASLGGEVWSLDQIEHGILRGDEGHASFVASGAVVQERIRALHQNVWQGAPIDARIHVALNCAALSCPNLRSETPFVFRSDRLEAQLDALARAFAGNAAKGAGPDGISSLFNWFAKDFEGRFGSATNFVALHREGGLAGVDVDRFLPYDWTLNIAPAP